MELDILLRAEARHDQCTVSLEDRDRAGAIIVSTYRSELSPRV